VSASWGNTSTKFVARNCLAIIEAAGADTPVYIGADAPLGPAPPPPPVHLLMGEDAFGGVAVSPEREPDAEPAASAIVRLARQRPGRLHLYAVAALTTIAQALELE